MNNICYVILLILVLVVVIDWEDDNIIVEQQPKYCVWDRGHYRLEVDKTQVKTVKYTVNKLGPSTTGDCK